MSYSSTNPVALISDGFGGTVPRMFVYASTHGSTDISYFAATSATTLTTATTGTTESGVGFFKGCGEGGRSNNDAGMRVGDIVLNVNRGSTDLPGITTLHSVISSTRDSNESMDISVSQPSF